MKLLNLIRLALTLTALIFISHLGFSQNWPKEVSLQSGGVVTIYQPQPESLEGNVLSSRAAVSVKETANSEPAFGAIWAEAQLLTDTDSRTATLESIKIKQAKFPSIEDQSKTDKLVALLEKEAPSWNLEIHLDEIVSTLETQGKHASDNLSTSPPNIIYTKKPTTLITIDGDPIVKEDKDLDTERVVNTPFFIIKSKSDNKFYIYGGGYWYNGTSVKDNWQYVSKLPKDISKIDKEIKKQEKENSENVPEKAASPPAIIITTTPAELIQSEGEADFATVEGSGLLYMTNSKEDIFMDINSQQYYVLLSGRWYRNSSLETGNWDYISSDQLPESFSKIPEGSDKDNVLANVAGTDAANEAKLDAQIPQTAKVDRNSTDCNVTYDGSPKFEKIDGTSMEVAVNTSSTVLKANGKYYCVENGVWFVSKKATGPWKVSTERPSEVEKIPPENQAYNTKYVYVYDVTPEYIYMGYTPGYLGTYVYGPTVVYGTGYYYRPWYGTYYYPRPCTWGFGMHYNPWSGWSMNFGFSSGWFSFGMSFGGSSYYHRPGGWWGPPVYRPPYRPPYRGGYYSHGGRPNYNRVTNNRISGNQINIDNSKNVNINVNNNQTNNLYNFRKDAKTKDINLSSNKNLNRNNLSQNQKNQINNARNKVDNMTPEQKQQAQNKANNTRNKIENATPQQKQQARDKVNNASKNMSAEQKAQLNNAKQRANNVYTDKQGNVFKRENNGDWKSRSSGNNWQSAGNNQNLNNIKREAQQRSRSTERVNNFQRSNNGFRGSGGAGNFRGGGNFRGRR
ncbi:hypothetical protein V6R21_21100 [Limibacter armeniacum]|uniref:hypothetical protein n=1 Tax=Limibacter armeniacum TaxID=466084 RepID=UPI002FE5B6E4